MMTDSSDWFILFKMPNCIHCENIQNDWTKLAQTVHQAESQGENKLVIGQIDCLAERS